MTTQALSAPPAVCNRRHFLQITAALGTLAVTGGLLTSALLPAQPTAHQAVRTLMGTRVHLTVVAADRRQAAAAIEQTFAAMTRLIGYFDHRQPTSPLAILNRTGQLAAAPPELIDLLQQAVAYGELTDGAFDVTVKPLLDAQAAGLAVTTDLRRLVDFRQIEIADQQVRLALPGAAITLDGIAKGRVIDGGVAALQALGFEHILVEAGGDLRTLGNRADGTPWRIGIAHPRHAAEEILATLPVSTQAVATSGDYLHYFTSDYRQHHIIDPRTGHSPTALASATVLAPTALAADALGTALLVMDSTAGLALAERLPGVAALLVTKDLRVLQSSGIVVN